MSSNNNKDSNNNNNNDDDNSNSHTSTRSPEWKTLLGTAQRPLPGLMSEFAHHHVSSKCLQLFFVLSPLTAVLSNKYSNKLKKIHPNICHNNPRRSTAHTTLGRQFILLVMRYLRLGGSLSLSLFTIREGISRGWFNTVSTNYNKILE